MHGLETLRRLNAEVSQPEMPGQRLRHHTRIQALRLSVASLPVDDDYRRWLYRSINLYADQIVERPEYQHSEGWDDLEALQQVTLGDMNEHYLSQVLSRNR